ncbi:HNH endonuclease [Actinobacillus porcitonsillarum]|nr:HNH endonuclease [Actinobacillus porcitonsillarum]
MKCFLCEQDNVEMSLEHSIPQFLGGKKSDDKFKRLNLCKLCNSKLGTHVDARFARSFINAMELNEFNNDIFGGRLTSLKFDAGDEIHDLIPENNYVEMMSNEKSVAFWIKENTPDFLGLVGGHAPLSKSKISQLFLFITKEDLSEAELKQLLNDIILKFKDYKKLEILLCMNFSCGSVATEKDLAAYRKQIKSMFDIRGLKFIWEFSDKELNIANRLRPDGKDFKANVLFDLNDWVRFLSKLFLGILCGYLGNQFTKNPVGLKLIDILRTYSSRVVLSESDINRLKHPLKMSQVNLFLLERGSITVSIFQIGDDIVGLLGIGDNIYALRICKQQDLSKIEKDKLNISSDFCRIPEGITLVLNKNSDKYLEYNTKDFFLEKFFDEKFPGILERQKLEIISLLK